MKNVFYLYLAALSLIIVIFYKPIFSVTKESILFGKEFIHGSGVFWREGGFPTNIPITEQDFLKEPEHLMGKALLNRESDSQVSLEALYKAIAKDPTNPLPHFLVAQLYLQIKIIGPSLPPVEFYNPTPAILHLKKAIQLEPDNGYLHHCLAEAYFGRFGSAKIKDVLAEIKKGNQAKDYNMYETEMVKAVYNCQRDEWLAEFSKLTNARIFGLIVSDLLSKRRLVNTLVAKGERLRLTGNNQQATEYFSETLRYGDRMVDNTRSLLFQMIAVAIKEIARQPLRKIYHIENNQLGIKELGLDHIKDQLRCLKCSEHSKYSEARGTYILWIAGHGVNAHILSIILIGLIVILFLRLVFSRKKAIRVVMVSVFTHLCFYLILCSIIAHITITNASLVTRETHNHTTHYNYSLICILPFIVIALIYVIYKVSLYIKAKALKGKGIIIDKKKLTRLNPIVVGLIISGLPLYLITISFNYQIEQQLKKVINVDNFNEISGDLQVTDKEVKETLDDYLTRADSILAKMERNEALSSDEPDEKIIIRGLFYSQDERFIEKLLPKLEAIADHWSVKRHLAENYHPAFLPVAKKLLATQTIRDWYDWKLYIIRESDDRDSIGALKKLYNDWAEKEENTGTLVGIAVTLFTLGDRQTLYDLIESSPAFAESAIGSIISSCSFSIIASITDDKKIREQIIRRLEQGRLWSSMDVALETIGVNIPFQSKKEMARITLLGVKNKGAFNILRETANKYAIRPLMALLDKENEIGAHRIIFALGELKATKAIDIIKGYLTSEDAGIRRASLYALSKLMSKEDLNPILDQYENDADFYVRQAVWQLKNLH